MERDVFHRAAASRFAPVFGSFPRQRALGDAHEHCDRARCDLIEEPRRNLTLRSLKYRVKSRRQERAQGTGAS